MRAAQIDKWWGGGGGSGTYWIARGTSTAVPDRHYWSNIGVSDSVQLIKPKANSRGQCFLYQRCLFQARISRFDVSFF